MSVSDESFFASKSMILIMIGIMAVVAIVVLGVIVQVLYKQNVFTLVAAGISGITAHTTGGIVRNIQTDTPLRQAEMVSTPPTVPIIPVSSPPSPSSTSATSHF